MLTRSLRFLHKSSPSSSSAVSSSSSSASSIPFKPATEKKREPLTSRFISFVGTTLQRATRERKIDELADYVNNDLRFEFVSHFVWSMNFFTIITFTPFMYLVCEGYLPPSKIFVLLNIMSSEELEKQHKKMEEELLGKKLALASVVIGYSALFYTTFNLFFCYPRYHFFVNVLAPFYRKMNWIDKSRGITSSSSTFVKKGNRRNSGERSWTRSR